MVAKIRIYELARELGLSNSETRALTKELQIGGVKSHSSSIDDAQADRVRRKAKRDGLIREPKPPEPQEPKEESPRSTTRTLTKTQTPTKTTPPQTQKNTGGGATPRTPSSKAQESLTSVEDEPQPPTSTVATPADVVAEPASGVALKASGSGASPTLKAVAPVKEAGPPSTSEAQQRFVSSTGGKTVSKRIEDKTLPPQAGRPTTKKVVKKVVKKLVSDRPTKAVPPSSSSGKPIPPPPRPVGGRSIPPPPRGATTQNPSKVRRGGKRGPSDRGGPSSGVAGRGVPNRGGPSRGTPARTGRGRVGSQPHPTGPNAARGPAGRGSTTNTISGHRPNSTAGARGFSGNRSAAPTAIPPSGTPSRGGHGAGGRGGANQGRRPPRRKSRRRRNREELQPMDVPDYTPVDAPVPEGEVVIERASTAQDLGPKLNRTAADVVHFLLQAGEMLTATHSLSDDMIELFAEDIGAKIRLVDPGEEQEVELQKLLEIDAFHSVDAPVRAPVITVMGHVDHGKTLLLDRIRNANVVDGEAGGITQHIGAYQVEHKGKHLTFIDTPGHAAFTAMRARGASSTDIVVLVVAADDGVMPQTIEAINHAKAAEVPILVALNKIDRDNADPQKAIAGVAEHGLVPEGWGGDTIVQEVSALENRGIIELLDQIVLLAEVEDLRGDADGRATGVVLEANLNVGRGPVATVLVQRGTLNVGDPLVAGAAWGRVRALINDQGANVAEAKPSTPVQVLGLSEVADAGDVFVVATSEKIASRVAQTREHWQRQSSLGREAHALSGGARLEDIFSQIQRGESATLNMVVKADVKGSLEAVTESLRKLERDDVKIRFVHRGVGGITENDIALAAASNATILGFNVRPDRKARELAEMEKVEIRSYEIIYKLLEDIEAAMVGMLSPEFEEVVTGEAEVREIFRVPRIGSVAGCYVQNGVIKRGSSVRFLREGTIIWKGEISSLKRFAADVREVAAGFECGIGLANFQDLKQGDIIETFDNRVIERTLEG